MNSPQSWLCEFNMSREAVGDLQIPSTEQLIISDETLRDGEQHPGVVLTGEEKLEIARLLDELGVHEISVGTPMISEGERESAINIVKAGLKAKLNCLVRSVKADIDRAMECGLTMVRMGLPVGKPLRTAEMNKPFKDILKMGVEACRYAKDNGLYVIFSATDCTRAELDLLKDTFRAAIEEGGADRVRMPDTVGCCNPQGYGFLVSEVKKVAGQVPIEVHTHDDFGLALANCLAGLFAGARVLTATVNGIGERAGNTALEELLMSLRLLYGREFNMKYERLYDLSRVVQAYTRSPVSSFKAVVGEKVFAHESGAPAKANITNPMGAQAYEGTMVGQRMKVVIGKKSGRFTLEWKLKEMGIDVDKKLMDPLLAEVKAVAEAQKSELSDDQLKQMAAKIGRRS
jgi:isopropylmalate/homocitrate/citramalate synthase